MNDISITLSADTRTLDSLMKLLSEELARRSPQFCKSVIARLDALDESIVTVSAYSFSHPVTGQPKTVVTMLPSDTFQEFVRLVRASDVDASAAPELPLV